MGSVGKSDRTADIRAHIVGCHAIDRVELLRNERVLHTYCHAGTWDVPGGDCQIRLKMRIEFGWGPSEFYGLKTANKIWRGQLRIDGGRLVNVQGCLTCFGQRIERPGDRECTWQLETEPRPYHGVRVSEVGWAGGTSWTNKQALIFELEASPTDHIHLAVNGESAVFSVQEALRGSRVLASTGEAYTTMSQQLGLSPSDLDKEDEVVWHNAYKTKVHVAIPESGYTVPFHFVDSSPPGGWNWYRLRVSQLNGQMAWSSPIWLKMSSS
jgi:hypothetical protein